MPKVYIKTYGCQMNEYDSEIIAGILQRDGFMPVEQEDQADIILLNTCSVRDLAEQKVLGKIGELNKLKKKKDLILGICGCMAQNWGKKLLKKKPYLDIVCGTHQINNIGRFLAQVIEEKRRVSADSFNYEQVNYQHRSYEGSLTANVAIMRGCENFCTYCIVPYVRGKESSRPVADIVDEIKGLVDKGCKEVMLLGQNVNSYGNTLSPKISFGALLEAVNRLNGLERIRFVTSHPKDASEDLFKAIRDLDKVCEFLHLPIQAGSNKILKAMNRKYTREEYIAKIEKAREIVPHMALSTDLIVGFPGETDSDFQDTLDVMRKIKYDTAFMFKYSIRSGTKAGEMENQVEQKIKEERHQLLLKTQDEVGLECNQKDLGREVEVLVEGVSKRNKNKLFGRTRQNKITVFAGKEDLKGQLVKLKVTEATAFTLYGEEV